MSDGASGAPWDSSIEDFGAVPGGGVDAGDRAS